MIERYMEPVQGLDLGLPERSPREASFFLKKNLALFVYNTLRLLEKNPTNLPDTRLILEGRSIGGMSLDDLLQIKRFGDAARMLASAVLRQDFHMGMEMLKEIHRIVGHEEALEWGVFRTSQVFVGDCAYIPPDAKDIPEILREGFRDLEEIPDPVDKACNAFAFLSKIQPFFDCNKRTAMLAANGILLSEGLYPLFIPASLDRETGLAIDSLYEKGNPELLMDVLKKSADIHYPQGIDYGPRHSPQGSAAPKP